MGWKAVRAEESKSGLDLRDEAPGFPGREDRAYAGKESVKREFALGMTVVIKRRFEMSGLFDSELTRHDIFSGTLPDQIHDIPASFTCAYVNAGAELGSSPR